ncbi:MAG: hypothetical protein ABSA71_15280 [Desulfomonilia bacterium]|jgi:1-acyl-sn-glycerol-3-phosphate acyltransferase
MNLNSWQDCKTHYLFKKGGAHPALGAGVPIVPITGSGTYGILPKHSIRVRPGRITMTVLEAHIP